MFWARLNVSKRQGEAIDLVDLRVGVVEAERYGSDEAAEEVLSRMDIAPWSGDTSREVPFSAASKAALEHAVADADSRGDRDIGPAHLLRGVEHVTAPRQ